MTACNDPILIQRMSSHHVEGFHQALDAVARERRFLTFLEAPSLEETRAFAMASLADGNPHFVAVRGEAVVGWCDIQRHVYPSHAHRGSVGMGLIRDVRGKGLGRRLIEAALEKAWEIRLTRVELSVHADNGPALALYRAVGFLEEGRLRAAVFADGVYRDSVLMAIVRSANRTEI